MTIQTLMAAYGRQQQTKVVARLIHILGTPAPLELPERELYTTEVNGMAYTQVPLDYEGPALIILDNKATIGFSTVAEANHAASLAISHFGGYSRVDVRPLPPTFEPPVYESAEDWFFS